jgi:hypothetical protein
MYFACILSLKGNGTFLFRLAIMYAGKGKGKGKGKVTISSESARSYLLRGTITYQLVWMECVNE